MDADVKFWGRPRPLFLRKKKERLLVEAVETFFFFHGILRLLVSTHIALWTSSVAFSNMSCHEFLRSPVTMVALGNKCGSSKTWVQRMYLGVLQTAYR